MENDPRYVRLKNGLNQLDDDKLLKLLLEDKYQCECFFDGHLY